MSCVEIPLLACPKKKNRLKIFHQLELIPIFLSDLRILRRISKLEIVDRYEAEEKCGFNEYSTCLQDSTSLFLRRRSIEGRLKFSDVNNDFEIEVRQFICAANDTCQEGNDVVI